MNKKIFFSILGLILILNCKPNTKNEQQYWTVHQKEYSDTISQYPNFKNLLDAKMIEAKKIWAESEKITNEEEKAAKMKEANEKIDELLNPFSQIKYKKEGILKSIDKIDDKRLNASKDKIRDEAIETGRKTISEITSKLNTASPANEEDLKSITKECISSLISAQGALDRAEKAIKK